MTASAQCNNPHYLSQKFDSYRECIIINRTINNSNVHVGDYSFYCGYYHGHDFNDCILYLDQDDTEKTNIDQLIIGKFCSIASGVKFMLGGNHGHRYDWCTTYPLDALGDMTDRETEDYQAYLPKGNIEIGHDVWIGFEALIMPGVNIGHGAVIAARAVVTQDVAPYTIVGGVPAKTIGQRFEDTVIESLLKVQWWHWDIKKIKQHRYILLSNKFEELKNLV